MTGKPIAASSGLMKDTDTRIISVLKQNGGMTMKFKVCPLLTQNSTENSLTGESYTRTHMLPCIGWECVAFDFVKGRFYCNKFESFVELHTEE